MPGRTDSGRRLLLLLVVFVVAAGALGRVHVGLGRFKQGAEGLEPTLEPLARTGQIADWIANAGLLGAAYAAQGKAQLARTWGARAVERARAAGNPLGLSTTEAMASTIEMFLGDHARAEERSRAALDAADRAGDLVIACITHGFRVWIHARLGEYDKGKEQMATLRAILREVGPRLLYDSWFDAFEVELEARMGDAETAIALGRAALQRLARDPNHFGEAMTRASLGLALARVGGARLSEAAEELPKAIALFDAGGIDLEAARARWTLARVRRSLGDEAGAEAIERRATTALAAAELEERAP